MASLPPGPRYVVAHLHQLVLPPATVYVIAFLSRHYLQYAPPSWLLVLAYSLSWPIAFTILVYKKRNIGKPVVDDALLCTVRSMDPFPLEDIC